MAVRLQVVAHGRTLGSEADPIFGDPQTLRDPADPLPVHGRVQGWASGPEAACVRTVELLGGAPTVLTELAGPDFGSWTGRTLGAVAAGDPDGLGSWLADPDAAPHGGDSLAAVIARLGRVCDDRAWPEGRSVLVVTPLVAKLIVVHALGAGAELAFRIDVPPAGRYEISGGHGRWRLVLR